jgi:hypothetical protein
MIDPTHATCKRVVRKGGSQMTIYCQDFCINSISNPRGQGFVSIQGRWMNFVNTFPHPFLPFIKYPKKKSTTTSLKVVAQEETSLDFGGLVKIVIA